MKKILTIVIIALAVLLIYLGFKDKDIYYLSLGDSLANGVNGIGVKDYGYADYVKDYLDNNDLLNNYASLTSNNKRSIDLIKEIEENVKITVDGKEKTIQNALIKADIITISIGMNDLFSNITFNNDFSVNDLYNKLDEVALDLDKLFKLLRDYSKEEIIFIGFYNCLKEDELVEFFKYANDKISKLASSYDIDYLDIYEDFNNTNYFDSIIDSFPNKKGYQAIYSKIIAILEEKVIKKSWFLLFLFVII